MEKKLSAVSFQYSRIGFHLGIFTCLILIISGCGESFQPFQENDRYPFSIFGYLDASADTQWVRISPARQEFNTAAVAPDIEVTLKHLKSGETVTMDDSLFASDSAFIYLNFRTTMDIELDEAYLLKVESPDGAASRVTVTVPEELPTPRLRRETSPTQPTTYSLFIDDSVDHVADVQTIWYVRIYSPDFEERKVFSFYHRNNAERIPTYGGVYSFFIQPHLEMQRIIAESQEFLPQDGSGEIEVLHRQIYVASAGPEWNEEIASMDDFLYAIPDGFSNVEDGLGYMIGIDSKIIPFESCRDDQAELISCPEEEAFW